jgi:hypothetical protein
MYAVSYFRYVESNGDTMSFPIYPLEKLMELIKELEVAVIPKMNGILPIRRSEAITGAQAMFALAYFRVLTDMLDIPNLALGSMPTESRNKVRTYFDIQRAIEDKVATDLVINLSNDDPGSEDTVGETKQDA